MKASAKLRQEIFLQNLNSQIEAHLSDPTLNVKKLSRMLCVSRANLYRQLIDSVRMSTTEYLRQKRIEKAAKLLREHPDWTVYHVALEVGFNNHSYFTKRFREVFGMCPLAWREAD